MSDTGGMNTREEGRERTFVSTLRTLKQDGCSLLVVGTAPDFVYQSACQQMLGDSTHRPRRRLVVATDQEISTVCTHLSMTDSQPDPSTVKVLSFSEAARSVTTHSSPEAHIPVDHVTGSSLADLGIAISEAIAEFEAQESDLSPGELRVCLDSLTPLVDDDRETLFQFLDLLNYRIRSVSAMGHMHLPVERNNELVHLLEPLFDAVIELRVLENEPQQRWHLTEADLSSGWFTQK